MQDELRRLRDQSEEVFEDLLIVDARIKLGSSEEAAFWFAGVSEEVRRAVLLSVNLGMIISYTKAGYCDRCILKRLCRSPYSLFMLFDKMEGALTDLGCEIAEMEAKGMVPKEIVEILRKKHGTPDHHGSRTEIKT